MVLGFKAAPGEEPYFFGKVDGVDRKYRRVIAGLILPILDRQQAAVVIIGELFRIGRPQDFTVLGCAMGSWPIVQKALLEYDRTLQFRDCIVSSDKERSVLWRIPWSLNILTWYAPAWALQEMGRQRTDELIKEDRLHFGAFEATMETDPELFAKALQLGVCYAIDWNLPYVTKKPKPFEMQPVGARGL